MKLNYFDIGQGFPLIILHGLYGSSDNWYSVAKKLSNRFRVIGADLRNHGASEHTSEHTYQAMANDVHAMAQELQLNTYSILGHSMGGKVAMQAALQWPDNIHQLVVVDIAPFNNDSEFYTETVKQHSNIIKALQQTPIHLMQSRSEVDAQLSNSIYNKNVRLFLLKNLKRDSNNGFEWKINLSVLENNLGEILGNMETSNMAPVKIPALFIKGGVSGYITENSFRQTQQLFTNAQLITIEQAGHWVHAEAPKAFIEAVDSFLR